MKTTAFKYPYYWLTLLMSVGVTANAQKLPNVQQAGLYAPANVKVDGKATEWDNQFQAYNKSTSVFYTMANNGDNLYLVIQATDKKIIDKILGGGISLIMANNKDKKIAPISITSPLMPATKRNAFNKLRKEPAADVLELANRELASNFKEIPVSGISAIPDSSVSVFNEYGIKLSGQVDINNNYTVELAIPLKYLTRLTNSGSIDYNIRLNALKFNSSNIRVNGRPADASAPVVASLLNSITVSDEPMMELMNPTDFSGIYTLVKK